MEFSIWQILALIILALLFLFVCFGAIRLLINYYREYKNVE